MSETLPVFRPEGKNTIFAHLAQEEHGWKLVYVKDNGYQHRIGPFSRDMVQKLIELIQKLDRSTPTLHYRGREIPRDPVYPVLVKVNNLVRSLDGYLDNFDTTPFTLIMGGYNRTGRATIRPWAAERPVIDLETMEEIDATS